MASNDISLVPQNSVSYFQGGVDDVRLEWNINFTACAGLEFRMSAVMTYESIPDEGRRDFFNVGRSKATGDPDNARTLIHRVIKHDGGVRSNTSN